MTNILLEPHSTRYQSDLDLLRACQNKHRENPEVDEQFAVDMMGIISQVSQRVSKCKALEKEHQPLAALNGYYEQGAETAALYCGFVLTDWPREDDTPSDAVANIGEDLERLRSMLAATLDNELPAIKEVRKLVGLIAKTEVALWQTAIDSGEYIPVAEFEKRADAWFQANVLESEAYKALIRAKRESGCRESDALWTERWLAKNPECQCSNCKERRGES